MLSVADAIEGRQSIRAFLADKPVPRETIERILAIASRAPSGSNIQPWKVRVVSGPALARLKTRLMARHEAGDEGKREYNYYPVKWREPYIGRRRATGWGLYGLLGIGKGDTVAMRAQAGRNFVFFDAPVGLIFSMDRDMEVGSWLDTGMFIQSVMIAARGEGLETCPQAAFCNYADTIQDMLAMPADQIIVCGMALGYADPLAAVNSFRTDRIAVGEFAVFHDDTGE